VGGWCYRCDLRHVISKEICLTGRYAPMETALLQAILQPGATFVDVGGNIGYFALAAAARVGPGGRVVSLEPDPRMAAALRENLAMNGAGNVTALEAAAAASEGTAELTGFEEEGGNWGVSSLVPGGAGRSFTVRCAPLDALLDASGVETVDLVKIDVEGAEMQVLAGMREGIASGRYRRVLVELHPWVYENFLAELASVAEGMAAAGYRGWLVEEPAERVRRAYYGGSAMPRLTPLDAASVESHWPHVLWTLPGYDPPGS
jgi:FkbM family methyltransferase